MRLQVDSPMLAKGSNPVMDASKIPLDKIKKHKKGIDTINKMCYNIIVKRKGKKPQEKKIKKV